MKPMVLTSTNYVTYNDIKVNNIDLLEDSWELNSDFADVINLLNQIKVVAPKKLTEQLIEKVRKQY